MSLFLTDAYPESLPARATHYDCGEAEATIDRLMAELVQTTVQREEALELANQAGARIDILRMERDAAKELVVLESVCALKADKQRDELLAVIGRVQLWLAEDGYAANERSRAALREAFLEGSK